MSEASEFTERLRLGLCPHCRSRLVGAILCQFCDWSIADEGIGSRFPETSPKSRVPRKVTPRDDAGMKDEA